MAFTIFRELSIIETELNELENTDLLYSQRRDAYYCVLRYLKSGIYSNYKHKKAFLDVIFSCDLGFVKKDALLAKRLNISESTVRLSRARMSAEAVALMGNNVGDIILHGSAKDLARLTRDIETLENIVCSIDLLPFEVISLIHKLSLTDEEFAFADMKREMTFLHWYSIKKTGEMIMELDTEKLRCLLGILDNPTSKHYKNLVRVIGCDNLLDHVKEEDKALFTFPPPKVF
jgi:hypothetical protein